jgi:hypothetical protein
MVGDWPPLPRVLKFRKRLQSRTLAGGLDPERAATNRPRRRFQVHSDPRPLAPVTRVPNA